MGAVEIMYNICIVEDQIDTAQKLRAHVERYALEHEETFEVTIQTDAITFLQQYRTGYDIVFMDIELPNMNGMEAAFRLRELDQAVVLIFVTNMAQFASQGYKVDALDYIVKPVQYVDLAHDLDRAIRQRQSKAQSILITYSGGFRRPLLRDIRYIEVHGHTLIYHTTTGTISATGTLQEVEEKLRDKGFLRCNKFFLINFRHISSVRGYMVQIHGGEELQISRQRKKSFMNELAALMGEGNIL